MSQASEYRRVFDYFSLAMTECTQRARELHPTSACEDQRMDCHDRQHRPLSECDVEREACLEDTATLQDVEAAELCASYCQYAANARYQLDVCDSWTSFWVLRTRVHYSFTLHNGVVVSTSCQ